MRLLHTTTLKLYEFFGDDIPDYAILSHRWEHEEVTLQDLQDDLGPSKIGYQKIQGCCRQAAREGLRYAWVDSCCIDKTSSAELSEVINSMFEWYTQSRVCYAYLADVPTGLSVNTHHDVGSAFRRSKWWTRGWTLQELLAPRAVEFYDCDWKEIGTKDYWHELISSMMGIYDLENFMDASVAQKMSWASKRVTERLEDQAYCLMGLFNVNMPPLYGEGWKAFERLQLEILRTSDDESIFAWGVSERVDEIYGPFTTRALLARSPFEFNSCENIVRSTSYSAYDPERPPFSMTNKGFRMELILKPTDREDVFLAPLNCERGGKTVALRMSCFDASAMRFFREYAIIIEGDAHPKKLERTILFIKPSDAKFEKFDIPRSTNKRASSGIQKVNGNREIQKFSLEHSLEYGRGATLLHFRSSGADSFVIILKFRKKMTVDIFIPEKNQSTNQLDSILSDKLQGISGSDRVSRRMASGRSVSGVLRNRMLPGRISLSCTLDINIDPDWRLRLRWPDLSNLTRRYHGSQLKRLGNVA